MPRKIIIHAGFHKTGTSSVQQVLRANRPLLQPELAMRLKGQMQDLMHATRGYSTWRDDLTLVKAATRFGGVLDDLVAMRKRALLLSAEEFSGHMPGRGDLADYSAAPILLSRYCDEITARFPNIEQVIYFSTRAPESWLQSAYWEHVKSSSMTLDYDTFATTYEKAAELEPIVKAVRKQVNVAVHHTALEDCRDLRLGPADPVFDLCDISPSLREKIVPQPIHNERLDKTVLLALLEANREYADHYERKAAKQIILAEAQKNDQ